MFISKITLGAVQKETDKWPTKKWRKNLLKLKREAKNSKLELNLGSLRKRKSCKGLIETPIAGYIYTPIQVIVKEGHFY